MPRLRASGVMPDLLYAHAYSFYERVPGCCYSLYRGRVDVLREENLRPAGVAAFGYIVLGRLDPSAML